MDDPDWVELQETVRALGARIDELERRADAPAEPRATVGGDGFWGLEGLQARLPDDESTADGAVMIVGSLTLPTGASAAWQQTGGTAGLLEDGWSERAATIAALGSPVRLELVRRILCGASTTAELAEGEDLGTTGQLHHHLRQLVAAGWVRHSGRGRYEIPAARIVPLLALVLGAER